MSGNKAALLYLGAIMLQLGCSDYLYMSLHDYPNLVSFNIAKPSDYNTDVLDISAVDWISSDDIHFRGMYQINDTLFVANSKSTASFIGEWECGGSSEGGLRFRQNFTGYDKQNPGLVHPYGIRWHPEKKAMYVSTQDTQALLLYDSDGSPAAGTPAGGYYPGAIVVYGPYLEGGNGVRDVELDVANGLVFVAMETLDLVLVYSADPPYANLFNISYTKNAQPIGLALAPDAFPNVLFIGDNEENAVFAVYYTRSTSSVLWDTTDQDIDGFSHPAGMAVGGTVLYVVEQKHSKIWQINAANGKFIGELLDFSDLDNDGENLLYVPATAC